MLSFCLLGAAVSPAFADTGVEYTLTFNSLIDRGGGVEQTPEYMWTNQGKWAFRPGAYNKLRFTSSFNFQAGYWYTLHLSFVFLSGDNVSTSWPYRFTLSLGGEQAKWSGTITGSAGASAERWLPETFTFYCDTDFSSDGIIIEIENLDKAVSYAQLEKQLVITLETDAEHQANATVDAIDKQTSKVGGFFDKLANKIKGFFDGLLDGIKGLFVPSDGYFQSKQEEIQSAMEDRLGMVYQAGSLLGDVVKSCTSGAEKGTITFPQVKWEDEVLISEQEVRVIPEGFEFLQTICKTVTTIVICLAFLNMLRLKFEQFMGGPSDGG